MKEQPKKQRENKIIAFLSGNGFYVILSVCVLAIGVSAYALFFAAPEAEVPDNPAYMSDFEFDPPDRPVMALPTPEVWISNDDPDGSAVEVMGPALELVKPTNQPVINKPEPTPTLAPTVASTPEPTVKPTAKPVQFVWPLSSTAVVSAFSADELVYNKTLEDWRVHLGVDLESDLGAKVYAIADGTVEDVYDDPLMGTTVVIAHADGLRSLYANLQEIPTVKKGGEVSVGDTIGGVGDTAIGEVNERYHLHFAMKKGDEWVDPMQYLPKK